MQGTHATTVRKLYQSIDEQSQDIPREVEVQKEQNQNIQDTEEIIEESLSLEEKEIEMITKALEKFHGKRKQAAVELGISERTLYRKIKEYGLS